MSLRAAPPEPTHAEVAALCESVAREVRADLSSARILSEEALAHARQSGDPRSLALAHRARAVVEWASNSFSAALGGFEESLAIFDSLGDELESARTRSNAIQTLIYLSRYDQALEWAATARDVFSRHGDLLRLARLNGNIANLLYRQDRFEEAIQLYDQVEAQFRRNGEPRDVAAVLRNKAVCQISLSRFDDALATHAAARAYCLEHAMAGLAAEADYNIAYLHFLRGDYLQARRLYEDARRAAIGAKDTYHAALCDLDQAEMFLELNLSEDAGVLARRARLAFRKLGLGYEAAKAQALEALCAGQRGDIPRALSLLRQSRRLFAGEQNAVWPPLIDLYSALLLEKSGQLSKSRRRCRKALGFFSPTVLPGKAILCRLLLARLDLLAGRLRAAEAHAAAARRLLPVAQSPSLAGQTWFLTGRLHESRGASRAARRYFERSEEEFELLRDRISADDLRISFYKDKVAVYESHFRLLLSDDLVPEAFHTAERSKSRGLARAIAPRSGLSSGHGGDPAPSQREELESLYRQRELLESSASPDASVRAARLRDRIHGAESALRQQLDSLGGQPASSAAAATLEQLTANLPAGSRVLYYFRSAGHFYAFVIGGPHIFVRRLGAVDHVLSHVRFLQFHLTRARSPYSSAVPPDSSLSHLQQHLRSLYDALVAPVRPAVDSSHCIVVPHSFLHCLPFHALHDGAQYLGESLTLSSCPSASVLLRTLSRTPNPGLPHAVFGVPDELAPSIHTEAEFVSDVLPGSRLFLGKDATIARLRECGAASSIIHIATHGRFRQDNPWFSSIRLGDGNLSLYDLYSLRLSADLVTLSGCNTGLSVVVEGDEILGLVRGLLQGGAGAALVSLWDVGDESAASFMKSFYSRVRAGDSLSSSLQIAQADTRARYPHPFHWAPFVLLGNPGPVISRRVEESRS